MLTSKSIAITNAKNTPAVQARTAAGASKPATNTVGGNGGHTQSSLAIPAKPIIAALAHSNSTSANAVGGPSHFRLSVSNKGQPSGDYVDFELGPARKSFAEKQGQSVPGAGAGMEFGIKTSLAKLMVPGGVPIYQPMGIAEETLEFVGAFIGYDNYYDKEFDAPSGPSVDLNAWEKAQRLAQAIRAQREMVLEMDLGYELKYRSTGGQSYYKGFVRSVSVAYATAQRVYYHIVFAITNKEAVFGGKEASLEVPFMVPTELRDALASASPTSSGSGGSQPPRGAAPAGGDTPANVNDKVVSDQGASSTGVPLQKAPPAVPLGGPGFTLQWSQ